MDNANKFLCIVNEKDNIVGTEMALEAHIKTRIKMHRAFSVFIFNSKGELLMQKRSKSKLVFPGLMTNSVCSHPFINNLSFEDPILDCKIHAIERIRYELGITSIKVNDLNFFERILYFADDSEKFGRMLGKDVFKCEIEEYEKKIKFPEHKYDSNSFCEYELDYLFWCICDDEPNINESEIDHIRYVNRQGFKEVLLNEECSPWLSLINDYIDVFDICRELK